MKKIVLSLLWFIWIIDLFILLLALLVDQPVDFNEQYDVQPQVWMGWFFTVSLFLAPALIIIIENKTNK